MKKIKLTKEEQEIENAIERGEYIPITGKELKDVKEALAARKKDLTLTIRVNSNDIRKIKKEAKRIGIKYQTYISEIIHTVAQKSAS